MAYHEFGIMEDSPKKCQSFDEYEPGKLSDETETTHSHIIEENDIKKVGVHFERPTEYGFDTARCILRDHTWIKIEGYTDEERNSMKYLNTMHIFYINMPQ